MRLINNSVFQFIGLFCFSILSVFGLSAQEANLTITIDNIDKYDGKIYIGIYNDSEDFPEDDKAYKNLVVLASDSKVSKEIVLPHGQYAIALYHDEDKSGKINKNFFGIPTEPYGFSQNFVPKVSAPDFDDTKFTLEGDKEIKISLIQ